MSSCYVQLLVAQYSKVAKILSFHIKSYSEHVVSVSVSEKLRLSFLL